MNFIIVRSYTKDPSKIVHLLVKYKKELLYPKVYVLLVIPLYPSSTWTPDTTGPEGRREGRDVVFLRVLSSSPSLLPSRSVVTGVLGGPLDPEVPVYVSPFGPTNSVLQGLYHVKTRKHKKQKNKTPASGSTVNWLVVSGFHFYTPSAPVWVIK